MEASRIVKQAWRDCPPSDRALLRSAGCRQLARDEIERADAAIGLWIPQLRIVLINAAHPAFHGLDQESLRWALSRVAWHEWAHALSIDRAGPADVAEGARYLRLLPESLAKPIRGPGYRRKEYTHEIVAEVFSMLMIRRRLGKTGKPPWLHKEIYELVRRVTGWNQ
jgi:hypothetical protein